MMKKPKSTPAWLMLLRDIVEVAIAIAMFGIMLYAFLWLLMNGFQEIKSGLSLKADTVNEEDGVGRVTASVGVVPRAMAEAPAEEEETALWVYVEGEGTPPEWYRPDEPMAVEWYAAEPHPPVGVDPGGIDWGLETTLWGWDGHSMTVMELNLFARVFYLEFFGASVPCCEAGCDAMLNLWASGIYGQTLFEALSYCDPQYGYTYEVYPWVWTSEYDAEGLEWCREFCLERFVEGPIHETMYFQLYGFHDTSWTIPLFECDGVYFSKGK